MMSQHDGEYERVEQELSALLNQEFGIQPQSLDLSAEEQTAFESRMSSRVTAVLRAANEATGRETNSARHRPLIAVAAVALVAIVLGVGISVWPITEQPVHAATPPVLKVENIGRPTYPLSGSSPDEELRRLARIAEGQALTPVTGDVQRVRTAAWWLNTNKTSTGPDSRVTPVVTNNYRFSDGDMRVITTVGEPLDDAGNVGAGSQSGNASDEVIPASAGDPLGDPAALPLDPAELRRVLLGTDGECAGIEGTCLVNAIQTLGLTSVPIPELQAALLRALVNSPDIAYAGSAEGRNGRMSEVFILASPDRLQQRLVLFDAATGFFSGDETVLVEHNDELNVEVPAVIEFNTVLEHEWVTEDQLPSADLTTD
jgi:hypothetical protein